METVPVDKYKIANEATARIAIHSLKLLRKRGGTLRLLKGLLCYHSYNSVFKYLLDHNKDMQRLPRGARPADEDAHLARWAFENPLLAAAMAKEEISPRRWLSAYGYVRPDGSADLFALLNPFEYELNSLSPVTGRYRSPVSVKLRQDFPSAFDKRG